MDKKTIKNIDLKNKAVVIRVDYNIPFDKKTKEITDETRILQSLDTINYVLRQNPKRIVLMSHLGKPKGERKEELSFKFLVPYLKKKLKQEIYFFEDYTAAKEQKEIKEMENGEIVFLENVRFYKEEKLNRAKFAKKLANLGDVFVNDAFGSCHRAHASVVGVTEYLPSVAGFLLEKEIDIIGETLEKPKEPFVVVLGGAKATTKIPMIDKLMTKADYMLLGGGVANTFLKAFGYNVGRSVYSKEAVRLSQTLIWKATRVNTKLFMPTDVVIGSFASQYDAGVCGVEDMPMQFQALDIGPETCGEYEKIIEKAGAIIWNGPVGANEIKAFSKGTKRIYEAIIKNKKAVSIVGGGDTLASIKGADHLKNITHISTGGGAMLEFIERGSLPGVDALDNL